MRRRVSAAFTNGRLKLGRCVRCMTATAAGVISCGGAVAWLGPHVGPVARATLYVTTLIFASSATLHLAALLYRMLTRLEGMVSNVAGSCNCTGRPRR